jgi:NodT family efflux transporter outer membrane factor (OMF) lipoprotein
MITRNKTCRFLLVITAGALLVTGCAVGPDFKEPEAPQVSDYTSSPIVSAEATENVTGGEAQHFVTGQDIPGEWWTLFHSKPLNALIERSLKANPNIQAAQAALKVAHENVLAQQGTFLPSVSGGFSATRAKSSNELSPIPSFTAFYYSLYTPQVSVSYVPDVFGLNRRTVENLKAQEEQARFALVATDITLSSNVVAAAIQEASLRDQIAATSELISIDSEMLRLTRNQLARGIMTQLDVATQESQLAQVSAALPPLLKQLAQERDLLAALSGAFPSEGPSEKFEMSSLQLPQEIPLSIPSRLVEQRPDVRQAEENLHAASAQIGIAVANRLPNLTLTANLGSSALQASQIFAPGTGFWTLAGNLTQPIFEGGTLMHKERAARDAFVQAQEQYRAAVLTAFQNVADSLNALQQDAAALKAAAAARDAAKMTLDLTKRQLQTGAVNNLALLSAEQGYQQSLGTLVQAEANRYADTAALFQALGGGWWNRVDVPKN